MIKLRQEQLDALRAVACAQVPARLVADLKTQGYSAERLPPNGDIVAWDSRGFKTSISMTRDGLPTAIVTPSGATYRYEHDRQSRLVAKTWPGGERLEARRDAQGKILEFRRPDLLSYHFKYDQDGTLEKVTHPDASSTHIDRRHSAAGDLETVLIDRTQATTTYRSDSEGRLVAVIDPLGRSVDYERDLHGRLQTIHFPDGTAESYGFDPDLRVGLINTRDGKIVSQIFDESGRVTGVAWMDGSFLELQYSGGYLAAASNPAGRIERTLDPSGLILAERSLNGAEAVYSHDSEGRICGLSTSSEADIRFSYDGDGRLSAVFDWNGREARFQYSPSGALAEILYPNGLVEKREYARVGRLAEASVRDRQGSVARQSYTYDLCERLTGTVDEQLKGIRTRTALVFHYDAESRVIGEVDADSRRALRTYTYDAKGNMVQDGQIAIQLGSMDQPTCHGAEEIRYDGLGNMVSLPGPGGSIACRYSLDGTLREAKTGGRSLQFTYDGLRRRILKTDGRSIWRYGWAGHQLLWEEHEEKEEGKIVRRDYLWLPQDVIPFAFREEGRTYWLQSDVRGAIIRAFDEAGNTVWRAEYDAYGNASFSGTMRQPWRLAGHYQDEETGLCYNLTRYYSPRIKSYLSRDLQWFEPEASNYGYARSDPWNRIDPFGTLPSWITGPVHLAAAAATIVADSVKSALDQTQAVLRSAWNDLAVMACSAFQGIKEGIGWGLGQLGEFFGGAAAELWGAVKGAGGLLAGTWNITAGWIFNPEQAKASWARLTGTLSAIWNRPGLVWEGLTHNIVEAWKAGHYAEALGRVVGIVGPLAIPGVGEAGAAGDVGVAAEVVGEAGEAARAAEVAAEAGEAARGGEVAAEAGEGAEVLPAAKAPGAPLDPPLPAKGAPKPSPKFTTPTNPPQLPPADIPPGWRIREGPPTEQYPNGYWKLEKPMKDGSWQPIDPSTMKPGTRAETHVPFPPR